MQIFFRLDCEAVLSLVVAALAYKQVCRLWGIFQDAVPRQEELCPATT